MGVDRSRLPAVGPDPPFAFPPIVKRRLETGLHLWTVQRPDLPVVCSLLVLPYGAAADPPHRPGLAALAGDLLDEGAGERSADEIHAALQAMGAQFDIEVSADATWLALTTLTSFVEDGLALVAEMVARPRFEASEFLRVRDLRLSRLRQLRSLPSAVADRMLLEALYRDHPYGHWPLGTEASLAAMQRDEVAAFHYGMADPAWATLIMVGDLSADQAARMVEQVFSVWKPSGNPGEELARARHRLAQAVSQVPPQAGRPRPLVVDRARAPQSELRVGQVAAPRNTPDYHALLVLNTVLGGQFTSRLNMKLREEKGLTYGARSVFDFRRGVGPFIVSVAVQADATAAALEEIRAEIGAIRGPRPVSEEELTRARAALVRGYPRNFETVDQIARAVAQLVVHGLPDDEFARFGPAVAAVDLERVAEVARRYLNPERLVPVIVGDGALVASLLSRIGFDEPVVVSLEER